MLRALASLGALLFAAYVLFEPVLAPCRKPQSYRIGSIDSGFGMTRGDLLVALERAEKVWERPIGQDLLSYDPDDGEVVVRMVYDERQERAVDHAERKKQIDRGSDVARDLRERLEDAGRRHETGKAVYLSDKAAHDARVAAHNRTVKQWNARGGAPDHVLAAIRDEELALEDEAGELEERRVHVNAMADHANKLSERYRATIDDVNDDVEVINETAGQEFQQGRYISDGNGERIEIFKFDSIDDLVHVLAHELGHALGMGHNDDPGSIMYGKNASGAVVATPRDLADLRAACRF